MKLPSCPRTLIINILRKHPDGLTLTSIAQLTSLHRHTATKYIYELKGAGIISERDVGSAKLCYLKEGLSKEEEKKVLGRLKGENGWNERMTSRRKSSTGQVQILTLFVLLFLIPATVIIAQNATQDITPEGSLILEQTNFSEVATDVSPDFYLENQSYSEDNIEANSTIPENMPELNETFPTEILNESSTDENLTPVNVSDTTESNITLGNETVPEQNITDENETILPDKGIFENQSEGNLTLPEEQNKTSITIPEPTIESPIVEQVGPVLDARIISPDKTTRGENLDISVVVANSGDSDAKNVGISWVIPSGFEIVSGEAEADCGIISPNSECTSNITVSSSLSIDIGRTEFKVKVRYEK